MPNKLIVDRLWLCLCPSFTPQLLQRTSRYATTSLTAPALTKSFQRAGKRHYSQTPRRQAQDSSADLVESEIRVADLKTRSQSGGKSRPWSGRKPRNAAGDANAPLREDPNVEIGSLSQGEIEQLLETAGEYIPRSSVRSRRGAVKERLGVHAVRTLLKTLIGVHGVKPTQKHYRALILAHVSAEEGSVPGLKDVLQEMDGVIEMPEAATLHAALKVRTYELKRKVRFADTYGKNRSSRFIPTSFCESRS